MMFFGGMFLGIYGIYYGFFNVDDDASLIGGLTGTSLIFVGFVIVVSGGIWDLRHLITLNSRS